MKRILATPLAIVMGLMLVTASVFGAAQLGGADINSVDDLADQVVGSGEALVGVGTAAAIAFVAGAVAHEVMTDDSSVNETKLEELDALETKQSIHTSAATQEQNNENTLTSMGNYLEDTESIALMEGKNAYIRALENGSSEAAARNVATEAVANYYATKQKNLIAAWNTTLTVANSSRHVAENTTGVSSEFVAPNVSIPDNQYEYTGLESFAHVSDVSLVNASTEPVMAVQIRYGTPRTQNFTVARSVSNEGLTSESHLQDVAVKAPNDNYEAVQFLDPERYESRWSAVQSQNEAVQAQLDTFVNNTYDDYAAGAINTTDLVDPYLGAREYSPDEGFQSWALTSTLSMGLNGPDNLSNVGKMVVTDHTVDMQYEGIVLTDENPTGGLEVGETYHAAELNGTQMVVTSSTSRELTGEFTLNSAVSADGQEYATNESVEYKEVNYQTANTTEFKNLMEELTQLQKEINDRQQQTRSGTGGGSLGNTKMVMLVLAALGAAGVLLREN